MWYTNLHKKESYPEEIEEELPSGNNIAHQDMEEIRNREPPEPNEKPEEGKNYSEGNRLLCYRATGLLNWNDSLATL